MPATIYALAVALLTGAPGSPVPPVPADQWLAVRDVLVGLAVDWELLDPREDRLTRLESLGADVAELRRRHHELAGAPRLAEAARLPAAATVEEYLAFNRAYRRSLERRAAQEPDRADELGAAARDAERLYRVWDAVRDAGCRVYYVPVRRAALRRLRDQVGPAAFATGQLPPHVPIWRFTEAK